jgi:hypothetical protein
MRERGATLREIGWKFNICPERVRQTLLKLAAQERKKAEAESTPFTPDAPLGILQLSTRSSNCLSNENMRTVRDLLAYSKAELLRLPNFGRVSLEEVLSALARHGCRLADKSRLADKPRDEFLFEVKCDATLMEGVLRALRDSGFDLKLQDWPTAFPQIPCGAGKDLDSPVPNLSQAAIEAIDSLRAYARMLEGAGEPDHDTNGKPAEHVSECRALAEKIRIRLCLSGRAAQGNGRPADGA